MTMDLRSSMILAVEILESVDLDEVEQGMEIDVEEVDDALDTMRAAIADGWTGWRPT